MRFNIMSQGQPGANNGSFLPNICERNDMSLEGKCCWEKGNSVLRTADMFYLSETFPPPVNFGLKPHLISYSLSPSSKSGCRL